MVSNRWLLLATVTFLTAGACSKSNPPGEATAESAPATPVQVAAAQRKSIHTVVSAEAILYPIKQATIVPKISAPVARFLVERGTHVRAGQLLAVLENRDLLAAAQESKQLYEQAEAGFKTTVSATMPDDLTKARSDVDASRQAYEAAVRIFESRQTLYRQGALAQRQVDDARLTMVQAQSTLATAQQHFSSLQSVGQQQQRLGAQAQLDAARAHYEGAAAQASYAEVRSPMDGVISDRPINVGEMASSGSALLSVVDISGIVARANLPVTQAATLTVGRPATISGAGTELQGKVTVVSPAVDPNTTTVQVWVQAANPQERMKLGTTVQIAVDAAEIPNAIVIPAAALLSAAEGGERVMVIGTDSLAHERAVKVGVRSADGVQILDGVAAGEQVITEGALGLDDKAKVRLDKPDEEEKGEAGSKETEAPKK